MRIKIKNKKYFCTLEFYCPARLLSFPSASLSNKVAVPALVRWSHISPSLHLWLVMTPPSIKYHCYAFCSQTVTHFHSVSHLGRKDGQMQNLTVRV